MHDRLAGDGVATVLHRGRVDLETDRAAPSLILEIENQEADEVEEASEQNYTFSPSDYTRLIRQSVAKAAESWNVGGRSAVFADGRQRWVPCSADGT